MGLFYCGGPEVIPCPRGVAPAVRPCRYRACSLSDLPTVTTPAAAIADALSAAPAAEGPSHG